MRLVILESPYAGDVERNVAYARACMADCLRRGEAPIASHLLYTQPGVLDDNAPDERRLGIDAGLAWAVWADAAVFYVDLGASPGMLDAVERHKANGVPIEVRELGGEWVTFAGVALHAAPARPADAPRRWWPIDTRKLAPTGHAWGCGWHVDQHPHECTCGAISEADVLRRQLGAPKAHAQFKRRGVRAPGEPTFEDTLLRALDWNAPAAAWSWCTITEALARAGLPVTTGSRNVAMRMWRKASAPAARQAKPTRVFCPPAAPRASA